MFFVLYRVPEDHKTFNASQCISGEASEFYLYLITTNDGNDPSWKEFRPAYISRYHNPMAREEILRHKLAMIRFKGTQRMSEYCEQFRHYEGQIYDMAFPDRFTIFLGKLPQEAAMFIRNADLGAKDMEVIYRLARTWATNPQYLSLQRSLRDVLSFADRHYMILVLRPALSVIMPSGSGWMRVSGRLFKLYLSKLSPLLWLIIPHIIFYWNVLIMFQNSGDRDYNRNLCCICATQMPP